MAMLPKAIARGKADYPVRSVSYRPRTPSGEYIEIPDNLGKSIKGHLGLSLIVNCLSTTGRL